MGHLWRQLFALAFTFPTIYAQISIHTSLSTDSECKENECVDIQLDTAQNMKDQILNNKDFMRYFQERLSNILAANGCTEEHRDNQDDETENNAHSTESDLTTSTLVPTTILPTFGEIQTTETTASTDTIETRTYQQETVPGAEMTESTSFDRIGTTREIQTVVDATTSLLRSISQENAELACHWVSLQNWGSVCEVDGRKKFFISYWVANFSQASKICEQVNMTLLSSRLNSFISGFKDNGIPGLFWIGLSIVERDVDVDVDVTWTWINGTDFNKDDELWDEGQPNYPRKRNEKCGVLTKYSEEAKMKIHDYPCHKHFIFICECADQ